MPQPTSFTTIGKSACAHNSAMRAQQSAKARVAFRLKRLLQRIEMQHERVGFEHLDESPALREAVTLVELHRAEICEQQNLRSVRAHVEAFERLGRLEQHATGAQTHRQAVVRRDLRQAVIDRRRLGRSTRHARDQQRRRKPTPEEMDRRVHVGQIDFRQRAMRQRCSARSPRSGPSRRRPLRG